MSAWHREHQLPDDLKVAVRKTGSEHYPWEARCTGCRTERVHIIRTGAAVVNSQGLGNATWDRARDVALRHLDWHAAIG